MMKQQISEKYLTNRLLNLDKNPIFALIKIIHHYGNIQ